ncbi:MAG TPA: sulfatase [Planctomycetota bacterium]|nr:sulfatase [Planctomycetota bacterium]
MAALPRSSVRLAGLILATGLMGCSPERPMTRGRLALQPVPDGEVAPLETRVERIVFSPGETSWQGRAPVTEPIQVGEESGLRVQGGESQEIVVGGAFDASLFNVVWLEVLAMEDVSLRLGVEGKGANETNEPTRSGSLDVHFVLAGTRQRIAFDLRSLPAGLVELQTLQILGRGLNPDWALLAVEFAQRAPRAWLPGGANPLDLVAIDGDSRRGQALAGGIPLSARVRVPAGGQLRFSYGPAERHPRPAQTTHLLVSADGTQLVRVQPEGGWSAAAWSSVVLDLAEHAHEELTLRFELTGASQDSPADELIVLGEPVLVEPAEAPPTVLLVTSDTHRADHVASAPGAASVHTPALDALARQGVLFSDCFATSNITLPSHAALLTGLHPRDTGITNNRTRLGEQADTLAERFQEAGYATLAVTSAKHMNHPWSGLGQGFDRMAWPSAERDRSAPESVALLRRWMAEHEDRPLFIWLHLYDAHRPYDPPDTHTLLHYPAGQDPRSDTLPSPSGPLPPHLTGVRDLDFVRALYRGEVSHLDAELGALLKHERMADAIVAVTGDHGESLGEQGLWWDHVSVYPSVLHVPLILRWPGGPAGLKIEVPMQHAGLGRSLLELAGLPVRGFPGANLLRFMEEDAPTPPRFAWGEDAHALSVTHDSWHLVMHLHVECVKPELTTTDLLRDHALELFNIQEDPSCTNDLSQAEPARTAELGKRLLSWIEGAQRTLAEVQHQDAAGLELLAALGYGGAGEGGGPHGVDLEQARALLAPFLER